MDTSDEYFEYGGEEDYEEECEEEEQPSDMWGSYAWAPIVGGFEKESPLDIPMYSAIHYNITMHYQKEKCTSFGAWNKKALWDSQVAAFDALHEFWTGGMLDYLESIREEKI
jgi:hypothetical protein